MDSYQFDIWYDQKVQEVFKKLPDANLYHNKEIEVFVDFSKIRPMTYSDTMPDSICIHTLRFRKHKLENGNYFWKIHV